MKNISTFAAFIVVVTLFTGYQFMSAQWSAPTATAPGNNTAAPINVGSTTQAKSGNFMANILAAATSTWSPKYCDELGNNCWDPATGAPGGNSSTTITVAGICFEPALAVTCNWNWSGDGSDNRVDMAPVTANPTQVCSDVGRTLNYYDVILAKCGTGRYEWSTGSWSTCNAPVREYGTSYGTQTRTVQCLDTINGNVVVADANCTTAKPDTSQTCSIYWGGKGAP